MSAKYPKKPPISIDDVTHPKFVDAIKKLIAKGFPTRITKGATYYSDQFNVVAKKGHVSVRGYSRSSYNGQIYSNFKMLIRNKNGGYEIRDNSHRYMGIDKAIEEAELILSDEEAPKIPTFSPDELPEPNGFTGTIALKVQPVPSWYSNHKGFENRGPCVSYAASIIQAGVDGIVSFDEKLFVSPTNILDPNREAWFSLACSGRQHGNFVIISNGKGWYPVRKSSLQRLRVNMSNKIKLNTVDELIIQKAIEEFVKHAKLDVGEDDGSEVSSKTK
jgi:hypothetical protein